MADRTGRFKQNGRKAARLAPPCAGEEGARRVAARYAGGPARAGLLGEATALDYSVTSDGGTRGARAATPSGEGRKEVRFASE
ncbi:hypothetical protein BTJ_463 [Burkholderia thailandensis E444]|uniref:hypothetical protein n=1 Tax=Burkholderia thailandensis TaxID=57975 RepID=UPI0003EC8B28|nr:hypothetical protein [Burkholderia thailandensis]AHI64924.1 hypothetical protein BTL_1703 [Burkholderia thailandensis H0587]AHI72979.1 hypothetical protein BTQ_1892 [Burkholderia thailandensis 2002721723]AHI79466.1 hypothetical protein BTJ_463 [Burkholderia thailandensis E444]AIP25523.1 hypothetical protein DR63_306 [Burkholderia thailandensis E264]AJY29109.1 hypothetical protein BTM_3282 [Burkholderia thailandensis 34]KIS58457.1 hypothetical protein BTP_5550 [Burkholderia thailandensis Ph